MNPEGKKMRVSPWRGMSISVWLPLLITVVLANTFSRKWGWAHEWLWAFDTLAFSSVFLTPLCAGIAAFEVSRLAQAGDLLVISRRGMWSAVRSGLAVWLASILAVIVSCLVVAAWVLVRTGGLAPLATDMIPVLPMMLSMMAGCATRALLGWLKPRRITPAVAVIAVFCIIMAAHVADGGRLSEFVAIGGATSGLQGKRPNLGVVGWISLFYITLALVQVALLFLMGRVRGLRGFRGRQLIVVVSSLLLVSTALSGPGRATRFDDAPMPMLICSGAAPEVCLTPGYDEYGRQVRDQYSPYFEALRSAGAPVPSRIAQANEYSDDTVPLGSLDLMDPMPERVENNIVQWYGRECARAEGPGMPADAGAVVMNWLRLSRGGSGGLSSRQDLTAMPQEERDSALLAAIDDLQQCGQPGSTGGAQ